MIDSEKLARLRETTESRRDALKAGSDRYQARIAERAERLKLALQFAHDDVRQWSVDELDAIGADQLAALGVDREALQRARLAQQSAKRIKQENEDLRKQWAGFFTLMAAIESYAAEGVSSSN